MKGIKRWTAFTLRILNKSESFLSFLDNLENCERVEHCPQLGDDICWIKDVPTELFKYSQDFEWVKGLSRVWIKETGELVTKKNYKTYTGFEEASEEYPNGKVLYDCLDWTTMTKEQPVINEDLEV